MNTNQIEIETAVLKLLNYMDDGSKAGLVALIFSGLPVEELQKERTEYMSLAAKDPSLPQLTEAGKYSEAAYTKVLELAAEFQKEFKVTTREMFGQDAKLFVND